MGGLFSTSPSIGLDIPALNKGTELVGKTDRLLDDLTRLSEGIKSSQAVEKLNAFVEDVRNRTTDLFKVANSTVDVFTSIEFMFELMGGASSLVAMLSSPLTPMSVLNGLYTVFKLIKLVVFKLPVFARTALGLVFPDDEQFYDTVEGELASAEGGVLVNLVYAGLITFLPPRVRVILDSFQKYSRIRVLEDLDWLYQIADVIMYIPMYALQAIETGAVHLPDASWKKPMLESIGAAQKQFTTLLSFVPELTTNRLTKELRENIDAVHADRRILSQPDVVQKLANVTSRVESHLVLLRSSHTTIPQGLQQLQTEALNLYRSGIFLVQQSHPEPVAILLYSRPGEGKTVFTQRCRQYWSANGKNTIYDYTPTDSRSDFHDQYHDQNVWIHEDIGQRGEQDWAQYIMHIGTNPSRMDGAALDKKSTIFFRSQVIFGTTNTPLQRSPLVRVKDCGWTDARAIYRRWLVVDFTRDNKQCPVWKFDVRSERWVQTADTMDSSDPKAFCDAIRDLYKVKVQEHTQLVKSYDQVADYCLADAEGRTVKTVIHGNETGVCDSPIAYDHPRFQRVTFGAAEQEVNFSVGEQRKLLASGLLINGESSEVGIGEAHVGTPEEWVAYKESSVKRFQTRVSEGLASAWDFLSATFDVLRTQVPVEYWIGAGVFVGLSMLAKAAVSWLFSTKTPSFYEPFLHWGKSAKRTTAAELYAEAGIQLKTETYPSDAVAAVANNVLSVVFTYDSIAVAGHLVVVDHETFITNAHLLLESSGQPKEVFVKATDGAGVEKIAAFMVPRRWDLDEDLVVLTQKYPHVPVFRSLKRAMVKQPSRSDLYLVVPYGCVSLGVPERYEVTTGVYRNTQRVFRSKEGIYHNYDNVLSGMPGLCGALVCTYDGYIVGWHVASVMGKGYVRFWNPWLKEFITQGKDVEVAPVKQDPVIKGALVLDNPEFHHVTLQSGIKPSKMLGPMLASAVLSDSGAPLRVPAELGGTREVDGSEVRTYDYSRTKNLTKCENPIDMKALAFAKAYITTVFRRVTQGKVVRPLSNEEVVAGLLVDDIPLKRVNLEASAGVPWGGLVGEWVDTSKKEIHPKLLAHMNDLEKRAKNRDKHWRDVCFKDCNKDEMRDVAKAKKPRCFAAGPLHYTLLLRRWFGRFQPMFMKRRLDTGVMIGINATSQEWHHFWKKLTERPNHFDGDYEMWDGGMRREFQEELNDVVASCTPDYDTAVTLLSYLCETTHVGMDFTYMTNHSVPSGHGLTASYNSWINLMYVAYAWYKLVGVGFRLSTDALLHRFSEDIWAPVYGDDIVCSVASRVTGQFNALTYATVMKDIGLGFTSASKRAQDKPFTPLRDITFLKRRFYANRMLGSITGPLELSVLKGSCGFVHDDTRDMEITRQKVNAIQRELFLHDPNVYSVVWGEVKNAYRQAFDREPPELSLEEMKALYDNGELRMDMFEGISEGEMTIRRSKSLFTKKSV